MLYVKPSEGVTIIRVCKNDFKDPRIDTEYRFYCDGIADDPRTKLGAIPVVKPPYAEIVAINLNRGDPAWKVPFGRETRPFVEAHCWRGLPCRIVLDLDVPGAPW